MADMARVGFFLKDYGRPISVVMPVDARLAFPESPCGVDMLVGTT